MNPKAQIADFMKFISRGNIIDLAIGTVIGGAFSTVVTTTVKDILSPLLDLVTTRSLETGFVTLKNGKNAPYTNKEDAQKDGAVVIGFGAFIQSVINFLIQGFFVYLLSRSLTAVKKAM